MHAVGRMTGDRNRPFSRQDTYSGSESSYTGDSDFLSSPDNSTDSSFFKVQRESEALHRADSVSESDCYESLQDCSFETMTTEDNDPKKLNCISDAPIFVKEMVDCETFVGDVARFDVKVADITNCDVTWYKDDEQITSNKHRTIEYGDKGNCSLIIRSVSESDDAEYLCRVCNSHGEATCAADLDVLSTASF